MGENARRRLRKGIEGIFFWGIISGTNARAYDLARAANAQAATQTRFTRFLDPDGASLVELD
jgi:hypothetical protein